METRLNPSDFSNLHDFTISESIDDFSREGCSKRTSFVFDRRYFEQLLPESELSCVIPKESEKFKHLEIKEIKQETTLEKEERKAKRKQYRRSVSQSSAETQQLSMIHLNKMDKTSKGTSPLKISNFTRSCGSHFTERELIQPITAREQPGLNSYKRPSLKNLDELSLIEESREARFNIKIQKKLVKYLKSHDSHLPRLPSADQLDEIAQNYFDENITNATKEKFQLKRTSSVDLVNAERPRAVTGLIQVQKSMTLVKAIIPRLQFLQTSLYKVILEYNNKKFSDVCYKSKWTNDFFCGLDKLICSFNFKEIEMNPLKTFTHIISDQIKDSKMHELIVISLQIDNKEFENIMNCLTSWADYKKVKELTLRVSVIDHRRIKEQLDFSTDYIKNQQHRWFESIETKSLISQITAQEIIRCFIPDDLVLYKQIKVNDKLIELKHFKGDSEACQTEFFTLLFHAIYKSGFDINYQKKDCEDQAKMLIHMEAICKMLKNDLAEDTIPWKVIQKKLINYPAIPFSKFKNTFNKASHAESLDRFLIELTIPCIDILKLCTNSCWLRGDDCIRHLFSKLFRPFGDKTTLNAFSTSQEKGISCQIHIDSPEDYSVTQIKNYGTKPHLNSSHSSSNDTILNYTKTTFQWTVSPFKDKEKGISCWQGLLEIPHVEVMNETPIDIKRKILKILNNPDLVDYVANSLEGKPKIISDFK